jgi:hypothetical protein
LGGLVVGEGLEFGGQVGHGKYLLIQIEPTMLFGIGLISLSIEFTYRS